MKRQLHAKSLTIVEVRGEYHMELVDGAASMRLCKFNTTAAMHLFCGLAKVGIKLREDTHG